MKFRAEHFIIGLIDAAIFYFFYQKQINEWVMLAGLGISIFFLTRIQNIEDRISRREAINLIKNEAYIAQQNGEMKPGSIETYDAFLQEYAFENQFKPWKYLIGIKLHGDIPENYLGMVTLGGSIMGLVKRTEGWSFDDEPRIIYITAPGVEGKELPPKEKGVLKIGG